MLGDAEGEEHVAELARRRRTLGDDFEVRGADAACVTRLHEIAARERLHCAPGRCRVRKAAREQHTDILFGGEHAERCVVRVGGDHDFRKHIDHGLGRRRVEPAIDRDDAAEGGDRVALQRLAIGGFESRAAGDAARVCVLDDGDGRPLARKLRNQLERRVGVVEVVVGEFLALDLPRDRNARPGVAIARQIQGKELSYNNLNDADAAFELISEFAGEGPAVAIIKHANPCGVASGATLEAAYRKALQCDPVSAFGGIIAVNRRLDAAAAEAMIDVFAEVVIAPDADDAALRVLAAKKNIRVLLTGGLADPAASGRTVKSLAGGYLVQSRDAGRVSAADLKVVTKRAPTAGELSDMLFAFRVAKHVKSNAIVYVKDGATAGIGAGQMSRVDSARIAARKAEDAAKAAGLAAPLTKGSAVASDAFFPFADGLLAAAEAGATAVIQPGGSMRDAEVIAAADAAGLAMAFTGVRHFRH